MEKKYKYIDGVKYEVVPNYELGSDVVAPEGGGSDLPEYSSADAGRVLTVDSEGTGLEWSEIQGGGGGLIVTFTTNDNGSTYTCDKTVNEIYSAMQSKTPIFGYQASGDRLSPLNFEGARSGEFARASFSLIVVYPSDSYMEVETFSLNGSNEVAVTRGDFSLTAN